MSSEQHQGLGSAAPISTPTTTTTSPHDHGAVVNAQQISDAAATVEDDDDDQDLAPINLLPTECIVEIFGFLDGVSLCR